MLYRTILYITLNGEESLKKSNNSHIQIRIRIFTKIETILPCHTPNLHTKFHLNPATTFWDIVFTDNNRGENTMSAHLRWEHLVRGLNLTLVVGVGGLPLNLDPNINGHVGTCWFTWGVIDQFKGHPIKGRHAYESFASTGSLIN